MSVATGRLDISVDELVNTRWAFGAVGRPPHTETFRFTRSGSIAFYSDPNEASWEINSESLVIYRSDGALMWRSTSCSRDNGLLRIILRTPIDPAVEFQLIESDNRAESGPPTASGFNDSDFLFPKDLQVTATELQRVLLIGSCMTGLYHVDFASRHPHVKFDYLVYNFAREIPDAPPAPAEDYCLQIIQMPLRSVLTERVVRATHFNESYFLSSILHDACSIVDAMLEAALRYNSQYGLLSFVANFVVPQMSVASHLGAESTADDLAFIVRKLNEHVAHRIAGKKNVFLLDVDALANSVGKRYIVDDMIQFYTHNSVILQERIDLVPGLRIEPVPPIEEFYQSRRAQFFVAIYDQIIAKYRIVNQIDQVKAVIFDLDNTLWRGQIAEHYRPGQDGYLERGGWPLGIWEAIHHLRARGILVAICSKNDLQTVQNNWDIVIQPDFLQLSDFVSIRINWKAKSENIVEICRDLGVTAKSVVFVDDNPVERAAAAAAIPGLRTIGGNPYLTRRILLWASETQVAHLTDEAARREEMVRNQVVREDVRVSLTRPEFLASLRCKVSFSADLNADQKVFARVLELVNKTNQFNTTGKRWTGADIDRFQSDGSIIAFRVTDRFADYGLVGVLFVQGTNIIQFVMSCRILGMDVEQYAVTYVVNLIRAKCPDATVGAFLHETEDNAPCRDVFLRSGFVSVGRDGAGQRFETGRMDRPVLPSHISLTQWA